MKGWFVWSDPHALALAQGKNFAARGFRFEQLTAGNFPYDVPLLSQLQLHLQQKQNQQELLEFAEAAAYGLA